MTSALEQALRDFLLAQFAAEVPPRSTPVLANCDDADLPDHGPFVIVECTEAPSMKGILYTCSLDFHVHTPNIEGFDELDHKELVQRVIRLIEPFADPSLTSEQRTALRAAAVAQIEAHTGLKDGHYHFKGPRDEAGGWWITKIGFTQLVKQDGY